MNEVIRQTETKERRREKKLGMPALWINDGCRIERMPHESQRR